MTNFLPKDQSPLNYYTYQKAQYEFVDKVGNPDKLEVLFWHFGFFIDKIVAARLILLSEAISCAIKS